MAKYNIKTKINDDYETPGRVLDMILDELDAKKVYIWEPFKGSGHSTEYMRKKGFKVTNGYYDDFFAHKTLPTIPEDNEVFFDEAGNSRELVVVTNPPFSIKKQILEHFKTLGVCKIALLLPVGTLFTMYWLNLFPQEQFQVVFHTGRCKFIDPVTNSITKGTSSFDIAWLCHGLSLKKDIQYK
jgi:hypothetical protein